MKTGAVFKLALLALFLLSAAGMFLAFRGRMTAGVGAVLFLLTVAVLVFIWVRVQSRILTPLSLAKEKMELAAGGDLSVSIGYKDGGEVGALCQTADRMIESLDQTMSRIVALANKVVQAVDTLRLSADKTASGAKNQFSQASQIAAAAEEMSQTITDIAKNASVAQETSANAADVAEAGQEIAGNAVQTVDRVYNSTLALAGIIEKLNSRAAEIGGIVTVIKDIADQTNLLALNAAIEAARAGEQGKGFAVVANEVRKLAERTIKATAEISEKISAVQADSEQTAKSMSGAASEVTNANKFMKNLVDSFLSIQVVVQRARDEITHIATAVDEQSTASEEVVKNIEKTSQIAGNMEEMADGIMHEINSLITVAGDVRDTTASFKSRNGKYMILDLARTDHRVFCGKIASCLKGDVKLLPADIPDHHSCRFGKWYFGEGGQSCVTLPGYRAIDGPHQKIHALAREAVAAYNAGEGQKAEEAYVQMEGVSLEIGELLDEMKRGLTAL